VAQQQSVLSEQKCLGLRNKLHKILTSNVGKISQHLLVNLSRAITQPQAHYLVQLNLRKT
jgi:hypothetical protein